MSWVHFAITLEEGQRVAALAGRDKALKVLVSEIEERWDEPWLQQTDKAWDAIHRSLTGGTLDWGETPLHKAVLGAGSLHQADSYLVCLLDPEEVAEVAVALQGVGREELRRGYDKIIGRELGFKSDEDFEYTWEYFENLKAFYQRVAGTGRWVMFTADQ